MKPTTTVINIRGTSGSGKSTLIRQYLAAHGNGVKVTVPNGKKSLTIGYATEDRPPTFVVGRYETDCGGCDTIKTQDEICHRVRKFARSGHVLFEGLLVSHIYGRYRDLAIEHTRDRGGPFHFAFLDTPLELCIERVTQRRLSKGNTKPLDPTNTIQKWHDSRRVFEKCKADGLSVHWLSHENALNGLEALLDRR